jgi:hypothetical protein
MMVYLQFHLPIVLLPWSSININIIRFCSFFLMFSSQFILLSSSSKSNDRALKIVQSIDDYLCQNHVFTCLFRQRYHQSLDNHQQHCKYLFILRSCLHYDTDTIRMCDQSTLSQTKQNLAKETPTYCFISSLYKALRAQHLRSIALPRTTVKCRILVLFLLFISFIIRIRVCS